MMVDFKFDTLYRLVFHREPPEVGLVEKVSGSLLVGGAGCAIPI